MFSHLLPSRAIRSLKATKSPVVTRDTPWALQADQADVSFLKEASQLQGIFQAIGLGKRFAKLHSLRGHKQKPCLQLCQPCLYSFACCRCFFDKIRHKIRQVEVECGSPCNVYKLFLSSASLSFSKRSDFAQHQAEAFSSLA